jgi:hypothetical protein
MEFFRVGRVAIGTLLAAAILAACGGATPGSTGAMPQGAIPQPLPPASAQVTRDGSWMLPEARHEQLLYASLQTTCCAKSGADVYVFPARKGSLSENFGSPRTRCSVFAPMPRGTCS